MFALYSFGISFTALLALIAFRYAENRMGRQVASDMRARADRCVLRIVAKIALAVNRDWEQVLRVVFVFFLHQATLVALWGVRLLERRLVRFTNFIKGKHIKVEGNGNASVFLQDVSNGRRRARRSKRTKVEMPSPLDE